MDPLHHLSLRFDLSGGNWWTYRVDLSPGLLCNSWHSQHNSKYGHMPRQLQPLLWCRTAFLLCILRGGDKQQSEGEIPIFQLALNLSSCARFFFLWCRTKGVKVMYLTVWRNQEYHLRNQDYHTQHDPPLAPCSYKRKHHRKKDHGIWQQHLASVMTPAA